MTIERIKVDVGRHRQPYDILVGDGLIENAAEHLSKVLKRSKTFIQDR